MAQASTSAAFTADMVRAGTVLAAEMIAKAAVLIAAAAAIHLMGEGRKPRGAGAAEPPPIFASRPPSKAAVSLEGVEAAARAGTKPLAAWRQRSLGRKLRTTD
jgi:hypothetical protein